MKIHYEKMQIPVTESHMKRKTTALLEYFFIESFQGRARRSTSYLVFLKNNILLYFNVQLLSLFWKSSKLIEKSRKIVKNREKIANSSHDFSYDFF